MLRRAFSILAIVAFAGCVGGIEESGGADAGSGADANGQDGDGGEAGSGVTVEFAVLGPNGQPTTQAPIEFEAFIISGLTVQLHDLRVIGDTAPSGNLVYPSSAVEFPSPAPVQVTFPEAPPGLSSRVSFDVERTWVNESVPEGFGGERLSVRVEGEMKLGNKNRAFEFIDDTQLLVDLAFDKDFAPGRPGKLAVELDPGLWLGDVDWAALDGRHNGNQKIQIGMGEEEEVAGPLRTAMPLAFTVPD